MRSHLFPFRTQKLSSFVPKILGGRLPGKIGRCRYLNMDDSYQDHPYIYSSIAQLAEHAAVNRRVVGSSPTWGAKEESKVKPFSLLFCVKRAFFCKTKGMAKAIPEKEKIYFLSIISTMAALAGAIPTLAMLPRLVNRSFRLSAKIPSAGLVFMPLSAIMADIINLFVFINICQFNELETD